MAATGIKFDDGSGGFATNCFPVRGLMRQTEDGAGAWLVAARAEQRRRFKAVICAKPRDYETIRQERKRAEKEGTSIVPPVPYEDEEEEEDTKILDGFFLMKHCCVDDPADLCSVNISGQGFTDVKEEDFALFDNVAYVNAAENFLPMESFTHFPIIRELEMPLNGLMNTGIKLGDFLSLELLDLSYNNLTPADILPLGLLPKLRVLHLTGNGLHNLPPELSRPHVEQLKQGNRKINRFPSLEILLLDDNKLSDLTSFAALAGLRNLKHLNMSKNEIHSVPQLMLVEGRHVTQEFDSADMRRLKSGHKSGRKSRAKSSHASSAASRKSRSRGDVPADSDTKSELPAPQNTSRISDAENTGMVTRNAVDAPVAEQTPDIGHGEKPMEVISKENKEDISVKTEGAASKDLKTDDERAGTNAAQTSDMMSEAGKRTPVKSASESRPRSAVASDVQNETERRQTETESVPQTEVSSQVGESVSHNGSVDKAESVQQSESETAVQHESSEQDQAEHAVPRGSDPQNEGENAVQKDTEHIPQNETENVQEENASESKVKTPAQNETESAAKNETDLAPLNVSEDIHLPETEIPEQTETEVKISSDPPSNDSEEVGEDKMQSSESLFDLDTALDELNLDKIDEKVERAISEEKIADEDDRRKTELVDRLSRMSGVKEYDDEPLPPPFPELRYLDVSHNLISEEEGILAVAAWPVLSELLIHKNPLTMETSGDPPLLKRFLHDRLGIHLQRKEPGKLEKPRIEMEQKRERTVKTKIYPVPRIDVDALLAIEAPKSRQSQPTAISEKTEPRSDSGRMSSTPVQGGFDPTKPLPPIPPTPDEDDQCEEPYDEDFDDSRSAASSSSSRHDQQADAFFMTAVGDQQEEGTSPSVSTRKVSKRSRKLAREEQEGRYKGYEALLDIDESQIEDAIPLPKDISGNIRALQYALHHPLVFRDNKVHLDKIQKPFKPYVKASLESSKSRKPRAQTVEEALATVRQRKTLEEEPLTKVLKDKKKYRKHFSGAGGLLEEVQRKYNMVRAASMRDNKQLQDIMQETIQNVHDASDSSHLIVS